MAIPQVLSGIDRSRGFAAARYLATRLALARTQAAARSTFVALRFEEDSRGVAFSSYADGNRNGVRLRDIQNGTDRQIEPPIHLADAFPGVVVQVNEEIAGRDPLRVGRSNLVSFSPWGTATSGTIYLRSRDGTQWAVRVLGATGRVRALRYDPRTRTWMPAF